MSAVYTVCQLILKSMKVFDSKVDKISQLKNWNIYERSSLLTTACLGSEGVTAARELSN